MNPIITSMEEASDANREIRCSACDQLLFDADRVHVPQFIHSIEGLGRPAGEFKGPRGALMTVTEKPSICATASCLEHVMNDPKWHRKTVEGWAEERRQWLDSMKPVVRTPSPEELAANEERNRMFVHLIERSEVLRKTLYELGKSDPMDHAAVCEAVRELAQIDDEIAREFPRDAFWQEPA